MQFQVIQPNLLLKPFIRQYSFMESELQEGNVTERVIPIEGIQLMIHYKNPFIVYSPDNTFIAQPRSILSGLSNTYSDVSTQGEAGVVFIQFYPAGACHFFDIPLSHFENKTIDLSEVYQRDIKKLEEQVYLEKSMTGKINVIEGFLMKRFSPIPKPDNLLLQTGIQLIKKSKGQVSISTLSDELAITPKSLKRKFLRYLGHSPKQFIKLIRYQETLVNFRKYKNMSLTEHAYLNGYYDQSHFIKDFKTFTGYTPKGFVTHYPDYNLNAGIQ